MIEMHVRNTYRKYFDVLKIRFILLMKWFHFASYVFRFQTYKPIITSIFNAHSIQQMFNQHCQHYELAVAEPQIKRRIETSIC